MQLFNEGQGNFLDLFLLYFIWLILIPLNIGKIDYPKTLVCTELDILHMARHSTERFMQFEDMSLERYAKGILKTLIKK